MKRVKDSIGVQSSQPFLGEYDFGWVQLEKGDFKPGTNGLTAMEACLECGACSEEKFLEEEQIEAERIDRIMSIVMPAFSALCFITYCSWYHCCRGTGHFYIQNH